MRHIPAAESELMKFYVFDVEPKVIVQAPSKSAAIEEIQRRGFRVRSELDLKEYPTYIEAHQAVVRVFFANGTEI